MNTCELRFPGYDAASRRGAIRWELFVHPDVRDVLLTPRRDTLQVLHRDDADPRAWSATLRAASFPTPQYGASHAAASGGGSYDSAA